MSEISEPEDPLITKPNVEGSLLNLKDSFVIMLGVAMSTGVIVMPFTVRQLGLVGWFVSLILIVPIQCTTSILLARSTKKVSIFSLLQRFSFAQFVVGIWGLSWVSEIYLGYQGFLGIRGLILSIWGISWVYRVYLWYQVFILGVWVYFVYLGFIFCIRVYLG